MRGMEVGDGNRLIDEGNVEWLDMLSGILNVSLGHGSPVVSAALREVLDAGVINTYDRPSRNNYKLTKLLWQYDCRFSWKLLNTGAEAVERAIQVCATRIGRKPLVAVLPGSFHGKSITMAGIRYDVPWGNPFDVITIDPDNGYVPEFDILFFEPIAGWDGTGWEELELKKLCNERDAFLVADEMITGFGRCGQRFLSNHADMIISGKGLAQGVPLAVLGCRNGHPENFSIGWNTTCGGNNLSATVGLRVLERLMINEAMYKDDVNHIEKRLVDMGFNAKGALGFKRMKRPAREMRAVFEEARVIVSWHDPFIRVGPSFITSDRELDVLESTLKKAETI